MFKKIFNSFHKESPQRDFSTVKEELIKAIKKPIPQDHDLIMMRAKWLAISCFYACFDSKDMFCKMFNIQSLRNKNDNLLFEMSILMMSKALETSKSRFLNEFPEKDKDDLDEFFSDYVEVPALDILIQIFADKTVDDIFDPYASYTMLKNEYSDEAKIDVAKKEGRSEFVENIHRQLRDFHGIDDGTKTKEQHFAKRVKRMFKEMEEDKATSFASQFISIQGVFLAMDAFAATDQEKINSSVKNFCDLFKEES